MSERSITCIKIMNEAFLNKGRNHFSHYDDEVIEAKTTGWQRLFH